MQVLSGSPDPDFFCPVDVHVFEMTAIPVNLRVPALSTECRDQRIVRMSESGNS